ncbi:hypothetical protein [Mycobacterium sp. OTB74]|jgi:hypothetical protein|nr:hypothetical protein [Mycobacterium sp. OTB74]MDH6245431.1 hypothetical protein [Mycobacterium sp. OTB74]
MTQTSTNSGLKAVAGVAATAVGGAAALYRGAEQLPLHRDGK